MNVDQKYIEYINARASVADQLIAGARDILKLLRDTNLRTKMKDGNDPVTDADLMIDKLVREGLAKNFPNDLILTEETSDGNFDRYREHEAVWIVDPLDGTKNYARRIPNYASGIGFVSKGKPLFGAIAFADDRCEVLRILGVTTEFRSVSATRELSQAMIGMDLPKKADARKRGAEIATKLWGAGVAGVRCMGSAVADAWRVSAGQLDAYIHTGLSPWDIAAPAAFILANGGRITRLDGSPWNVFCPDVLASNGHLHDDLLTLINS